MGEGSKPRRPAVLPGDAVSGPVGTERLPLFAIAWGDGSVTRRHLTAPSVPCPTSEAAAQAVERGTAQRQRDRILAYLRSRPDGATAGEIEAATGIEGSACRPRLLELAHGIGRTMGLGVIARTTETRQVPGHRNALIWRIR